MITERQFEELVAADAKAGLGPLAVKGVTDFDPQSGKFTHWSVVHDGDYDSIYMTQERAALLVAARNAIPGLIEFVRRAVEVIDEAEYWMGHDGCDCREDDPSITCALCDARALLADWRGK